MAAVTGSIGHTAMIEIDHPPIVGDMAGVAAFIGLDMISMFPFRCRPIMAAHTSAFHRLVIHSADTSPTEG